MALIKALGRSGKIVYGTQAVTEFRLDVLTPLFRNPGGVEYINGQPNAVGSTYGGPQAGTITIAGVTVTFTAGDVQAGAPGLAQRIALTAIAGFNVYAKFDVVYLTNNTVGPTTQPVLAFGTASGFQFVDVKFTQGVTASAGALDDILIQGRTPVTLTLAITGGTTPTIQLSNGTEVEQAQGLLTYGTAVTLTGGAITVTAPFNYARVTNAGGSTQAVLYVTR
jgi:hypothetical protein